MLTYCNKCVIRDAKPELLLEFTRPVRITSAVFGRRKHAELIFKALQS